MMQFLQAHIENATEVKAKVCCTIWGELETFFETLMLVPRYFKLEVFHKMPHLTQWNRIGYSPASATKYFR